jgi:hypothetical protein
MGTGTRVIDLPKLLSERCQSLFSEPESNHILPKSR